MIVFFCCSYASQHGSSMFFLRSAGECNKKRAYLAHFTFFYGPNKVYVNFRFHNSLLNKSLRSKSKAPRWGRVDWRYFVWNVFNWLACVMKVLCAITTFAFCAAISHSIRYSMTVHKVYDKTSMHGKECARIINFRVVKFRSLFLLAYFCGWRHFTSLLSFAPSPLVPPSKYEKKKPI